ncbi:MAG: 2-amino-4-hydroxy-6-hydroxymethyldihydropteridine diphosphokinase [Chloroflexota bacterium]|nr:2-amino-4-hydroxy-6-hydroxymethyldihydropteridine diphosphokinase [Chloroflexota bacterium]MDE2947585.1 2-amino-4-hydroxy-6-hydroxymethyldihydropteridine diphosphokinase [Chloroflexota bacterium]
MDIIQVKNLRLRTLIGFSAHELETPQDVVINLRIGVGDGRAGETDDPADAFNYRTVTKAIIRFVEGARFALVEKLAEEIARVAVVDFGAPFVEVRVEKPGALRRADSASIRIQRCPDDYRRNSVFLSLGSNIKPETNIVAAIKRLRRHTTVLALSSVYQTPPQGFIEQAPFLNMAVKLHTARTPIEFKTEVIDRIETQLKRVRNPQNKNAPRTIDLDISLWNEAVFEYGEKPWKVPAGDILRYAHVAIPLAELAPDYAHPQAGMPLREIAASFKSEDLRRLALEIDPTLV